MPSSRGGGDGRDSGGAVLSCLWWHIWIWLLSSTRTLGRHEKGILFELGIINQAPKQFQTFITATQHFHKYLMEMPGNCSRRQYNPTRLCARSMNLYTFDIDIFKLHFGCREIAFRCCCFSSRTRFQSVGFYSGKHRIERTGYYTME